MALSRRRERLLRALRDRKGRVREGRVLVEGPRAVRTAIAAGARVDFVVVGESGEAIPGLDTVVLSDAELEDFADTESPQGILAVVREPEATLPEDPRRILVLDRVQDPGNAGTLIRSAVALGVDRVVVLDGSVDPWNPKAVRASAGEAFRVPIHRMTWEDFQAWCPLPLLVADGGGTDVRTLAVGRRWALLVGNEGAGPRAEALERADHVVALPLRGGVESLNAAMAGSILLWALGPGMDRPDDA